LGDRDDETGQDDALGFPALRILATVEDLRIAILELYTPACRRVLKRK